MTKDLLKTLLAQEEEIQLRRFDNDTAWLLGQSLKKSLEGLAAAAAIEVYAFEQVIFSYAMKNSTRDHQEWLKRKRQAVMRFGHSSYYLGQYNLAKQRDFERQAHIDAKEYCAHGGAFPIRIKDCGLVGVATISGLAQEDDHNLVVAALRELVSQQRTQ